MIRRHWPFGLVLAAGAVLRIACEVAYRPALFYSDSWGYLSMAHGHSVVTFAPLRPSGYPVALKILALVGNGLLATTVVQHVAGLVTGALAYVVLVHLGTRRWLATLAGAIVVLDAWAIALEQYVLAEAFLALLLAATVWLSLTAHGRDAAAASDPPEGARRGGGAGAAPAIALAGLCLAAAALMKPVALFAAPAWLVWLAWARVGARVAVAGVVALVVPLLLYSAVHGSKTGTFGLTQSDGWFLYGRVGTIASCNGIDVAREARGLCKRATRDTHEGVSFFVFNRHSPAHRALGGISASSKRDARTDSILRHFALQVIEHRPGAYLKLVGGDFLRFMRPGPHARYHEDDTVAFPRSARIRFDSRHIRHRLFPRLRPRASAPSEPLRAYASVVHTSRPLVALFSLLGLVALALGVRRRTPLARAVFLPWAMALLVLLGTAATAGFALRYLVPVVPQLTVAGVLSLELLERARRATRAAAAVGESAPTSPLPQPPARSTTAAGP